jgi:hypothetical protein
MKEATKRATSAALAHMLAVTALLVIASILFYGGLGSSHPPNLQAHITYSK